MIKRGNFFVLRNLLRLRKLNGIIIQRKKYEIFSPNSLALAWPEGGRGGRRVRGGVRVIGTGSRLDLLDVRIDALVEIHVERVPGIARSPAQFQTQIRRTVLHCYSIFSLSFIIFRRVRERLLFQFAVALHGFHVSYFECS